MCLFCKGRIKNTCAVHHFSSEYFLGGLSSFVIDFPGPCFFFLSSGFNKISMQCMASLYECISNLEFCKVTLFQPLCSYWSMVGDLSVYVLNRWSLCLPICPRESSCPADVVFITSECFSSCCFPVVCGLCYVTDGFLTSFLIYCSRVWVCAEVSVHTLHLPYLLLLTEGHVYIYSYPFKVHPFLFKVHHSEDKKRKPSLHDIS